MHTLAAFEGLLSRQLLLELSVQRLVCGQLLPYCRAAGSDLPLAVSRVEAAAGGLHPEWFAGGPSSVPAAAPLMDLLGGMCRALEAQRGDSSKAGLAARLARVLATVGDGQRAQRLASAFGLQL